MRYIVETCTADEELISVTVSCRSNASIEHLFRKCASFMASELYKRNLINNGTEWHWDLPNIWRNGAVGRCGVVSHITTAPSGARMLIVI